MKRLSCSRSMAKAESKSSFVPLVQRRAHRPFSMISSRPFSLVSLGIVVSLECAIDLCAGQHGGELVRVDIGKTLGLRPNIACARDHISDESLAVLADQSSLLKGCFDGIAQRATSIFRVSGASYLLSEWRHGH